MTAAPSMMQGGKAHRPEGTVRRVHHPQGMAFLHRRGVTHLALHSANLLLTYGEKRMVCKVANFGHCKRRRDSYLSGLLTNIDPLPWLAPEIFAAPGSITEKVSLRCTSVQLSPNLHALAEACLAVFPDAKGSI